MNIIIAPAKKMINEEVIAYTSTPSFTDKTEKLYNFLKDKTVTELKNIYKCNTDIAYENYLRLKKMNLYNNLSPALFSYDGIQYKHLSPNTLDTDSLDWLNDHLRIISGFYGILKPFDGVTPYRLEMSTKLNGFENDSLYDYYGDSIYNKLTEDDHIILNLASSEYSKCIEKYLKPDDKYITCYFYESDNNKLKIKATLAKMARGEMVRFLAERKAESPNIAKEFNSLGFRYNDELSDETHYIFIK